MPCRQKKITMTISFLHNPGFRQRLIMHALFWILFFAARLYLTVITFNVYSQFPFSLTVLLTLSNTLFAAVVYYFIIYLLWPLVLKKKYLLSFFIMVSVVIIYTFADAWTEKQLITACSSCLADLRLTQPAYYALITSDLINIFLKRFVTLGTPVSLLLMLSIPLCIKFALNGWRQQTKALQLAKENIELEFNFLKAQLNPHFLFNSMNNIYGLILSGQQEKSASLVTRLSDLLRYLLYESNRQYMALGREIKLMADYAELERVRLNYTTLEFTHSIDQQSYQIAPILFMPLLENAFKFCPDQPGSFILIHLEVQKAGLYFSVTNTISPDYQPETAGGIGLNNLSKRLNLYYPGLHYYEVRTTSDTYTATIQLTLT